MSVVDLALHVEVDAGEDGLARGFPKVGRDAVVLKLADGGEVGHDDAVEAELDFKQIQ